MRFGIQPTIGIVLSSIVLVCSSEIQALASAQVSNIAKTITVRIEGIDGSNGSGFIIEKVNNRYKILTCRHVVENSQSFTVITADQQRHLSRNILVKPFGENLDLAIIEFNSDNSYPVATLGDSNQVQSGQVAYVAGFPARESTQQPSFLLFNEGKINARASDSLKNGYELVYNMNTLPGMSGGPVFDSQGHIIGIHGQGDQAEDVTVLLEASDITPGIVVKSGFNYAIPINTFKQFATVANVNFNDKNDVPEANLPSGLSNRDLPKATAQTALLKKEPKAIALKGIYDPVALNLESIDNGVSFDQKYTDKILTVQGQVSSIIQAKRSINVSVRSRNKSSGRGLGLHGVVNCRGVEPEIASRLNKRDFVTVRGTYRGRSVIGFGLNLHDCTIVAP